MWRACFLSIGLVAIPALQVVAMENIAGSPARHEGQNASQSDLGGEFGGAIGTRFTHTDNLYRTSQDTARSANIYALFGKVNEAYTRPRWQFSADTDLTYQRYQSVEQASELTGTARAAAVTQLLPRYCDLVAQYDYGQVRRDTLRPATVDNQTDYYVASVGPDLTVPLSRRITLTAEGRVARTQVQGAALTYDRTYAVTSLNYALSARSHVYVYGNTTRVVYDQDTDMNDYSYAGLFAGLRYTTAKTQLNAAAGTVMLRPQHGFNADTPVWQLSIAYTLSPRSTVALEGRRIYVDLAADLVAYRSISGIVIDAIEIPVAFEAYSSDSVALRWQLRGPHEFGVGVGWQRRTYDIESQLNNVSTNAQVSWAHHVFEHTRIYSTAVYRRQRFSSLDRAIKNWDVRLGSNWQLKRHVQTNLYVQRVAGDGVDTYQYDENRIALSVQYVW